MERLSKKIEIGANLAIVVVAALLAVVLIRDHLFSNRKEQINPVEYGQSKISRISLPDVDWQANGRTLVLAVSSTCHFCTESAQFYQQLVKSHAKARLVAVLPQPVEEGKRYLEKLGVNVDEIRQSSLSAIDVRGTPTLILVNNEGIVTDSWVGKLGPEQESEVLSKAR